MNTLKKIYLFLLLAMIFSCQEESVPQAFIELDKLCETRPDSVIEVLDKMDINSLDKETQWYARFLEQKAHLKDDDYYQANEDTIQLLLHHYENTSDHHLKAEVLYYAGCAYENMNRMKTALGLIQQASTFFTDDDMKGRCLFQTGNILIDQHLYEAALKNLLKAQACMATAGDDSWQCIIWRDIAWCQARTGHQEKALECYQTGLKLAQKIQDKEMEAYLNTQKASLLVEMKKYGEAELALRQAVALHSALHSGDDRSTVLYIAAEIYKAKGQDRQSLDCYRQLLTEGNLDGKRDANRELGDYYLKHGKPLEAWTYIKSYGELTDSINRMNAAETAARMNALYELHQQEKESEQLKRSNGWKNMAIISMFILCITLGLVIAVMKQHKKCRAIRPKTKAKILIPTKKRAAEEEEMKLQEILSSEIYQRLKAYSNVNKVHVPNEEWEGLKDIVYKAYPEMKNTLNSLNLEAQKLHICLLTKARFSIVEIAHLTNRSRSTVNSTRLRLCQQFLEGKGSVKQWDDFILSL